MVYIISIFYKIAIYNKKEALFQESLYFLYNRHAGIVVVIIKSFQILLKLVYYPVRC